MHCTHYPDKHKGLFVTATKNAFSVDIRKDGIAIITIDVPNESMNVLQATFASEANAVFENLASDSKVKACVLISGKDNSFVAGGKPSTESPTAKSRLLPLSMARRWAVVTSWRWPVMAALPLMTRKPWSACPK